MEYTHKTTGEIRVAHYYQPSTGLLSDWTDGYGNRVDAPEDISEWSAGGGGGGGGGSADIQALLDGISATHGSILYRDSGDWEAIAPAIEGQPLVSGGVGADPFFALGIENVVKTCKNDSETPIAKGTPVKVTGVHGELPKIVVANSVNTHVPNGSGSNEIFGIAAETINDNAAGLVMVQGTLVGLDTSGYSSGDFLFVAASGALLTATPPAAPYDRICIALVTKVDETDGEICIRTPQPIHLNDIVGLNLGTLVDKDAIVYDSATNTFTNQQIVSSTSPLPLLASIWS